jgi:hypothetical protein
MIPSAEAITVAYEVVIATNVPEGEQGVSLAVDADGLQDAIRTVRVARFGGFV